MPIVDSLARTQRPSIPIKKERLVCDDGPPSSKLIDNRYRVQGRLAQGGMGIIFRAEDVLLQRPAALKVRCTSSCSRATCSPSA